MSANDWTILHILQMDDGAAREDTRMRGTRKVHSCYCSRVRISTNTVRKYLRGTSQIVPRPTSCMSNLASEEVKMCSQKEHYI
jgi:hypothetical protein